MGTPGPVYQAESDLPALINRAHDGETITITRGGQPLVDLVQHRACRLRFGLARGDFQCATEIFDGPDAQTARMFYGTGASGATRARC